LLGSEGFINDLLPLIGEKIGSRELPKTQRLVHRPELKSIFPAQLAADKKVRNDAIRKAYLEYGYTMAAIARKLGIHYSAVSKIIKGER